MNKPFTPLKVSAPVRNRPQVSIDQIRPDQRRTDLGSGLSHTEVSSPDPNPVTATAQREVWHHLTAGLNAIPLNDFGRDWPLPRRDRIAAALARHPDDLCIQAARQAREIVQSQDRAPNITALFEKKLAELAAARKLVRDSLGAAA
jgi:hypothetical protein